MGSFTNPKESFGMGLSTHSAKNLPFFFAGYLADWPWFLVCIHCLGPPGHSEKRDTNGTVQLAKLE